MAYQLTTRTGRNFYEATSIMQNAIRKGDYDVAGYAMWELIPGYTKYLQKRLLIISAEDCFGIITKELEPLCNYGTEEALAKALTLMCKCKKNRDADYFTCNMMFDDNPTGLTSKEIGSLLTTAIRRMNVRETGNLAAELFSKSRKAFWKTLKELCQAYYPHLLEEISALERANNAMTKPAEETIFASKAIVLLWTKRSPVDGLLGHESFDFYTTLAYDAIDIVKPLDQCPKISGYFPEEYYNWHTTHGKYDLRLDTIHATENDQRLLTPLEENLFDDCSWNRDLTECLKRWNPLRRPIPYDDGKITVDEKYGKQE